MLQEFLSVNSFAFFLIFARMGTLLAIMPGFGANYIPMRARLIFAVMVTFVVAPILTPGLPVAPAAPSALVLLMAGEVFVGGFFGLLGRIVMSSLQVAGTLIAYFSSMANAFINDPIAEQQSSAIAGLLGTMGLLLIFVTDLHHLILAAAIDSYSLFEPGRPLPFGDFSEMAVRRLSESFALGLQFASPLILTALTYYIGIGLLGRLMPTLQVFFFGLPIQIAVQIWTMSLVVSGIMYVFLNQFQETFITLLTP